ncbi:hypothetical protein [Aliirhizobium smilacinae]|uniref:DUF945 domain-containing protein n=1 Tax=Aliirhizobium smilacinae TaxID=1395944 RepID=A0A5C4XPZ7_9HYPH|nr:hypothetical protein [Rhizobium smilacinae]TNM65329.1 hypothetical protein FHP24_03370 [Rhizobium smilacinae]
MSFNRKLAIASVMSAFVFAPVFSSPADAQQKTTSAPLQSVAEAGFRNWLSSFEKSGAKLAPLKTRYDAATDTLSVEGLAVSWQQADNTGNASGSFQFGIESLTIKSFQSNSQGLAFQSLTADGLTMISPAAPQSGLKVARFEAANGQIPSLASFVPDPTKPFTTQIRLMRLLASAKIGSVSANTVDIGGKALVNKFSLEDLSGAKARSVKMSALKTEIAPVDASSQSVGSVSAEDIEFTNIDFDPYFRLFETSAYLDSGSARAWTNMIESLTVHGLKVDNGAIVFGLATGKVGPLKVKQFNQNLTDIFDRSAFDPGFLVANPQDAEKVAQAVRDSFAIEAMAADGLTVQGKNQSGTFTLSLDKAAIERFTGNSISRVVANGLTVADTTGEVKLSNLDVGNINLVPVQVGGEKTSRTGETANTVIVPAIGAIKADRLSIKLQQMSASLDNLDLSMAYFIGATPTNVKLKLDHLKFLADQVANPSIRQTLTDLGYSEIDLSLNFAGVWDDSSSSVLIDDLSLVGTDMGTLSVSGAFAGITRAGLGSPTLVLPQELEKAGIRNLRMTFQNDSLFDRFVGKLASANGKSVDEIKKLLSSSLPNMFAGIAPADIRNRFVFAGISFLNSPQVLTFGASPSSAVSLQDVAAGIREPAKLPSLLNIEVSANNRR